jgi:hypothetical protein
VLSEPEAVVLFLNFRVDIRGYLHLSAVRDAALVEYHLALSAVVLLGERHLKVIGELVIAN